MRVLVVTLLLLGSCSNDVEITGFFPKSVYPGALLRIDGAGFDDEQMVHFAGGFASRASKATEKHLWVRVPVGSQSGAFRVGSHQSSGALRIRISEVVDDGIVYRKIEEAHSYDEARTPPDSTYFCGLTEQDQMRCWSDRPPIKQPRDVFGIDGKWKSLVSGRSYCGLLADGIGACWYLDNRGVPSVKEFTGAGWDNLSVFYDEGKQTVGEFATSRGNLLVLHSSDGTVAQYEFVDSIEAISMGKFTYIKVGDRIWSIERSNPVAEPVPFEPLRSFVNLTTGVLPIAVDSKGTVLKINDLDKPKINGSVEFPEPISEITGSSASLCAIDMGRRLWCFGGNLNYGVGDGTTVTPDGPIQVPLVESALSVGGFGFSAQPEPSAVLFALAAISRLSDIKVTFGIGVTIDWANSVAPSRQPG